MSEVPRKQREKVAGSLMSDAWDKAILNVHSLQVLSHPFGLGPNLCLELIRQCLVPARPIPPIERYVANRNSAVMAGIIIKESTYWGSRSFSLGLSD